MIDKLPKCDSKNIGNHVQSDVKISAILTAEVMFFSLAAWNQSYNFISPGNANEALRANLTM